MDIDLKQFRDAIVRPDDDARRATRGTYHRRRGKTRSAD